MCAFFDPELSAHRRIATLPLGGECTVGSRACFEDGCSRLLWQFYPLEFLVPLEEGVTEGLDPAQGPRTNWRPALRKHP